MPFCNNWMCDMSGMVPSPPPPPYVRHIHGVWSLSHGPNPPSPCFSSTLMKPWQKTWLTSSKKECHTEMNDNADMSELAPTSMPGIYMVFYHSPMLSQPTIITFGQHYLVQFHENWLKTWSGSSNEWCHCEKNDDVDMSGLVPMFMSGIYMVFDHFLMLWIGVWNQNHNISPALVGPVLSK